MKKHLLSALGLLILLVVLAINIKINFVMFSKLAQLEQSIVVIRSQMFQLEQTAQSVKVSWAENIRPGINHVSVDSIGHFDYPNEWGAPIVKEYNSSFWAGKKQVIDFNPVGMQNHPRIISYYSEPEINVRYPFDVEFSKPELAQNFNLQKAFMGESKSSPQEACKLYVTLFALNSNCQKITDYAFLVQNNRIDTIWFVATPKREAGASQPFYSGFIIHDPNDQLHEEIKQMITSLQPIGTWQIDDKKLHHGECKN